jgi:hypothetical protein
VKRDLTATRVNEMWVADITYVRTAGELMTIASSPAFFRRPTCAYPRSLYLFSYFISQFDLQNSNNSIASQ